MREFLEILGKYRILEGRPLGSIGLKVTFTSPLLNLNGLLSNIVRLFFSVMWCGKQLCLLDCMYCEVIAYGITYSIDP